MQGAGRRKSSIVRIQFLVDNGLPEADFDKWLQKYNNRKGDAKGYGIPFHLTFEDYVGLAIQAGLKSPSQIGQSIDSFCLGRVGDIGPYELGNCRFITQRQNLSEKGLNGGTASGAEKQRLMTKSNSIHRAKSADRMSKDFTVISPSGIIYEGRNLKEFSIQHNLDPEQMYCVCSGKLKHYKKWTGKYR